MAGIEGILFDLDGTLALTEFQRNRPANEMVAAEHGARIDPADWTFLAGTSEKIIWEHLCKTFNGFAGKLTERQYTDLVEQRFITNMHKVEIRPGMKDIFAQAVNSNVPMATATNSSRDLAHATLRHTGQGAAMKAVVTKCDVLAVNGKGKPHPDIFLMAAAKIGAKPENCVYFEDSRNGAYAALQALNSSGKPGTGVVIQIIDAHDEHQAVPETHTYVNRPGQIVHVRTREQLVQAASLYIR